MRAGCFNSNQVERFLEEDFQSVEERRNWASHLETCEDCRDLVIGHRELVAALQELSVPVLSSSFDEQLREELARQKANSASARVKRLLLQGYWLASLAISFQLLDSLGGSMQLPSALNSALVASGMLVLAGVGFLLRQINLGVSDLLLDTAVDPRL